METRSHFCQWLINLQELASEEGIVVEAQHHDCLDILYKTEPSIKEAFRLYKDFRKRYIALGGPVMVREYPLTPNQVEVIKKSILCFHEEGPITALGFCHCKKCGALLHSYPVDKPVVEKTNIVDLPYKDISVEIKNVSDTDYAKVQYLKQRAQWVLEGCPEDKLQSFEDWKKSNGKV